MTAAEREIELGEPQGDGASLRTHLQRLYRATGRLDPRLIAAPIPDAGRPIWELFVTLSAMRRTGMGLNPLAMTDIEAVSYTHFTLPTNREVYNPGGSFSVTKLTLQESY